MNSKNFKIKINFKEKMEKYMDIVNKTSTIIQKFKLYDIIGVKELNLCLKQQESIMEKLQKINNLIKSANSKSNKKLLESFDEVERELYSSIKTFGTEKIVDLLYICFDANYINSIKDIEKFRLINNYVNPIGFKLMTIRENKSKDKKPIIKNRIVEDFMISDRSKTLDCYDLSRTSNNFQTKVYGIKISFQNIKKGKTLIVCGIVDSVVIQCINSKYVNSRYKEIYLKKPKEPDFSSVEFDNFLNTLTLKEYLIYENDDIYNKFVGYMNQLDLMKKKTISNIVKDFLSATLFQQRKTLIQLLISDNNSEHQYLAYLLYDHVKP